MKLSDTIDLMNSNDYADRFKAEYFQLKIRYDKLFNIYTHWDYLNFKPKCDKCDYRKQLMIMEDYLGVLEYRAIKENIDLNF